MQTITHELSGIPLWLLREYLEELGGQAVNDQQVESAGWVARLTRLPPLRLGSLEVGQVRMELRIEESLADEFLRRLSQKTLRAGA